MSQIREKIIEIEKNISDGEMMLRVLRQLPESEETTAQIQRFEELVTKLQEYHNRYQNLEASSNQDLELQLQVLRDKHERIKELLEQTALEADSLKVVPTDAAQSSLVGDSAPPLAAPRRDSDADSDEAECRSQPACQRDTSVDNASTFQEGNQVVANDTHEERPSVIIDPTDWPLHFQAQVCQLSHMFTQVDRFEDMLNRLLVLVKALNLTPQEELLNDVSQRFSELKSSLTSLKKAYDGLSAHDTASDAFRARQLVSLRGFLVDLGRNLEVTKECFFSVANIVKQAISDHRITEDENEGGPSASNEGNDEASDVNPETFASPAAGEAESGENKDDEGASTAGDAAPTEAAHQIEMELMTLCKQRDALLHQLAQARAQTIGSISAAREKLDGISGFLAAHGEASNLEASVSTDVPAASLSENTLDEALPILRKLRARQNHLEEVREELRSLCVASHNVCEQSEADQESSSVSARQRSPTSMLNRSQKTTVRSGDSVAPVFNSSLKTAPARPKSAPKLPLPPRQKDGTRVVETSSRGVGYRNIPGIPPSVLSTRPAKVGNIQPTADATANASGDLSRGLRDVGPVRSLKTEEAVTDASCVDSTGHLYGSTRDSNRWHDGQRKQLNLSTRIALQHTAAAAAEITAKQLVNVCASESNSHEQTCMTTWGGSLEDDEVNNAGVYSEFLDVEENLPTTNLQSTSSKSSPFLSAVTHPNIDKTIANPLHGCPVRPSNGNLDGHISNTSAVRGKFDGDCRSEPVDIALPRLGHSPSPLSQPAHYDRISTSNDGPGTIDSDRANTTIVANGGRNHVDTISSHLASLERKVDHLTQTCQLLVSENLRLNSNLASVMMNQALSRPFLIPGVVGQEWSSATTPLSTCLIPPFNGFGETSRPPCSGPVQFASPTSLVATSAASLSSMSPMPFVGYPNYVPIQGSVRNTEPTALSTEQQVSMALTAPSVRQPFSSVETVQDEIQALSSQIMQQHLRVAQLQKEMHAMQIRRTLDRSQTTYLQPPQPTTASVRGDRMVSAHGATSQAGYRQAPILPQAAGPFVPPQVWVSKTPFASTFVSVARDAHQDES
nr:unnamed protein product [Spirometra erinaceieuropaei]